MNHNIQSCEVIGIDIAKNSFALHGADASGKPVYKFTGSRRKMLSKLTKAPSTKIYMEACGGAHCLGREFEKMGHAVELIPSIYVKAFVKRQKNDANDAAAIVEAASRPTMRKLKIKSEATQARASLFRARQLLVSQRTQTANSVRGLLTEFGVTVAKGLQNLERLRELVSMNKELPDDLLLALDVLFTTMDRLNEAIDFLTKAIGTEVSRDEDAKRLMEIPGIGPITAFAILAFAGDLNGLLLAKYFVPFLVTKNVPHVGHFKLTVTLANQLLTDHVRIARMPIKLRPQPRLQTVQLELRCAGRHAAAPTYRFTVLRLQPSSPAIRWIGTPRSRS